MKFLPLVLLFAATMASCDNASEIPDPMVWKVSASGEGVACRFSLDDYPQIHIEADYAAGEVRMECTNRSDMHFGFFDDPSATNYSFGFGEASIEGNVVTVRFEEDNVGGELRSCQLLVGAEGESNTTIAITRTFTEMLREDGK